MPSAAPVSFVRTRLTWQAYLSISYYSYLLNALGPLTPFLRTELGLSYTTASLHFSAYALGVTISGLVMNRAAKWAGVRRLQWTGVFGMAGGTLMLVLGQHPAVTVTGAFVMGLLGALIAALFSAALAEQHGPYRGVALTESTMMASLVSALAPAAVSGFSRTPLGWRAALVMMLLAVPALWLVFGRDPIRPGASGNDSQPPPPAGRNAPLPPAYWRFWALALLVEAVEFCIIFWAADFLEQAGGFSRADAALGVSAFLGAMLAGRWLVSRLLRTSREQQILLASLAAASAGFLLFWLAPGGAPATKALALIGLAAAGLGVAGLFPIVNSLALASAPERMVEASGRITLAVGLAIFLMPLALARLADTFGIRRAFALELVLLAAALLLAFRARRKPSALPDQPEKG